MSTEPKPKTDKLRFQSGHSVLLRLGQHADATEKNPNDDGCSTDHSVQMTTELFHFSVYFWSPEIQYQPVCLHSNNRSPKRRINC